MNGVGFIQNTLCSSMDGYEVGVLGSIEGLWDRQTLAILYRSNDVKQNIRDSIRRVYKPTSHSEGYNYDIDVYTNLNYNVNERDPAMRNIRVVYCDISTMTPSEFHSRFPNSYIIEVIGKKEEIAHDITRIGSGEILKISCDRGRT